MLRKFILKGGGREFVFPVTPKGFEIGSGVKSETVNIHELGDVDIQGLPTLAQIKIDCMLPAQDYPFAQVEMEPYETINLLKKWMKSKKNLRFIVSDTGVNIPVRLIDIQYGEQDGTNDVYATLTLREHRAAEAVQVLDAGVMGASTRAQPEEGGSDQSYTAVWGDCLCSICRRFYGDGSYSMAQKLAAANGKSNPNLLMVGEVLKIPAKEKLTG